VKFGQRIQQEPEGIPMAPLIDIVFLTLIFFMVTSVYSTLESEIDITLPTAQNVADIERTRGEIYINIRNDGSIVLNEREMDLPELQEVLYRVAEYFPGGAVIIRGDRDAYLGRAVSILDACKNADIQNISIAALKEQPGGEQ
jgi:biopolymer transport protein ExbD